MTGNRCVCRKKLYAAAGGFCWGMEERKCVIQTHSNAPFLYAHM